MTEGRFANRPYTPPLDARLRGHDGKVHFRISRRSDA